MLRVSSMRFCWFSKNAARDRAASLSICALVDNNEWISPNYIYHWRSKTRLLTFPWGCALANVAKIAPYGFGDNEVLGLLLVPLWESELKYPVNEKRIVDKLLRFWRFSPKASAPSSTRLWQLLFWQILKEYFCDIYEERFRSRLSRLVKSAILVRAFPWIWVLQM